MRVGTALAPGRCTRFGRGTDPEDAVMERIRHLETSTRTGLALALPALALLVGPLPAEAQFGDPVHFTVRVVDQAGRPLDGSMIRVEGSTGDLATPAGVDLPPGPQLVTIEPAAQGAMFPGGSLRPGGPNGLSRQEFVFFEPTGGDVVIEWRTAEVELGIADQAGAPIQGARWGFAGDGAAFLPGSLLLPVTDEALYATLTGASVGGWRYDVRAAFDGAAVDLLHGEQHEAGEGPATLLLRWQQTACTMGVVDGGGQPIRGATWTILGRTFQAGDPIALPATDESLYGDLRGAYADGFVATLSTNTSFGTGAATFEVLADGTLFPDFVNVNGGSFGLRCGVDPFPPLTTGTVVVRVLADGAPFAGAQVTLVDAAAGSATLTTGADGTARRDDVPAGAAQLTLAVPDGFHGVEPAGGVLGVTVNAGATTEATFSIAADETTPPPPLANDPETWNYWKREVNAALRGTGHREEEPADMEKKYPQAIFEEFAQHPADPVQVEGVTQVDPDGAGPKVPRRLALADMETTLGGGGNDARLLAKRELLVVLLNVVSGRLSLGLVVDDAGTTLEQEIRRLAAMINDGHPSNDALARNIAQRINTGRAGHAAPGPRAHGRPGDLLRGEDEEAPVLTAGRLGGSAVRLSFTLASPQRATLDVYDALGRRQARLYEGDAPSGTTEVTWSPATGRPGVYFARLVTTAGVRSAKVVAAR
jgi:hypothetical protein